MIEYNHDCVCFITSNNMREYLHAKIHKAIVTQANIDYIWSITIDKKLMDMIWLHEGQKVLVSDNTNGARLETYVIPGTDW
jgi:aspartate 1-decarboxylase